MSATPYSDAWVRRTVERLAALGLSDGAVERATGIDPGEVLDDDGPVSLEVAGPIDELLARLEEQREAEALGLPDICVVQTPDRRPHFVRRVDLAGLDALTNLGACHPLDEQTHTIMLGVKQLRAERVAPR
jgi:hypothetical protein